MLLGVAAIVVALIALFWRPAPPDKVVMFLEAGRRALNAEGPPKTVEWSNPKNETGGSFLVIGETTRQGLPCRRIKFATYAPGFPNPPKIWTTWTVCKVDDRWKVADTK